MAQKSSTFLIEISDIYMQLQKFIFTLLICICVAFIVIWYVKYLWKRRYLYYHSRNVPGPISLPFIGVGLDLLMANSLFVAVVDCFNGFLKKFPEVCALWFGPQLYYFVAKPELIEKILTSPNALNKLSLYEFVARDMGDGLFTAKATIWKKNRKILMPAFNQKVLNSFQEIFAEKSEELTSRILKETGNKNLDLLKYLSNCTLNILLKSAMGIELNRQVGHNDFEENLHRLSNIASIRIFTIWHHLTFTWPLYPIGREWARRVKKFKALVEEVVQKKLESYEKIATRRNSEAQIKEASNKLKNGELAFLDLIIEHTNFTQKQLEDELIVFIIAGMDTTASTLCFLFTVLALFPDIQQKVLDEILDIMGPDRRVLPSDLPHMKYTERVIKETLRLFPVGPFIGREFEKDVDAGEMVFPAGSSAVFPIVYIHRDPKYWPDPLKFDPDRFLPENVAKRHPCSYIPFSYGPRNCLGSQYGMMNMKTLIATILRKVKLFTKYKSIEELELVCHLVSRLKDGPKVWVEER